MSGALTSILGRVSRLTDRRSEAATRAVLKNLTDVREFTGLSQLPPLREGDFEAARAGLSGRLIVDGIEWPIAAMTPWDDVDLPPSLDAALHGFEWLRDFAALGTRSARMRALAWVLGWLDRYAEGSGPGWSVLTTSRRVENLMCALSFLEPALNDATGERLTAALPRQIAYLAAAWSGEAITHHRLRALSGIVLAAGSLEGFVDVEREHLVLLERQLSETVLPHGALPVRSPEAVLEVLEDLIRVRDVLQVAARPQASTILAAIEALAITLRATQLSDGTLARFHGGGAGGAGRVDRVLAQARVRRRPPEEPHMGFVRLQSGRTVAVIDCARPPGGGEAISGHASTLSFELSSGRQRLIVNCGPGATFGAEWARSPRTTAAHNTLALDKTSSSKLSPKVRDDRSAMLVSRPSMVTVSQARDETGMWLQSRHDGYLADYGLIHERRFFLGAMGEHIHGEDVLLAPDVKGERRFQSRIKGSEKLGVALALHFHAHPDVVMQLDLATQLVLMRLPNGETWVFRQSGGQTELETSAYLERGEAEPLRTRQIVVRARALTHEATFNWSFVRADPGSARRPARA
ncbi:MAG: heparinase II/III family protein [Pseudomonadota bacterium]